MGGVAGLEGYFFRNEGHIALCWEGYFIEQPCPFGSGLREFALNPVKNAKKCKWWSDLVLRKIPYSFFKKQLCSEKLSSESIISELVFFTTYISFKVRVWDQAKLS